MEKKPGNTQLDKLRRINIYEADYNGLLKYWWPKHSGTHDGKTFDLGKMQYGGRKGRNANDPALLNEIIVDFYRMKYK